MPALILLMTSPSKIGINLLREHSFLGVGFALSQDLDFRENSFRHLDQKEFFNFTLYSSY